MNGMNDSNNEIMSEDMDREIIIKVENCVKTEETFGELNEKETNEEISDSQERRDYELNDKQKNSLI